MQNTIKQYTFLLCILLLLNGCQSANVEGMQSGFISPISSVNSKQLRNYAGFTNAAQKPSDHELKLGSREPQVQINRAQSQSTFSIFALHENIFDKNSGSQWQPWQIHILRQMFEYGDWQHLEDPMSQDWDMSQRYYATDRHTSNEILMYARQLKQPGDWVSVSMEKSSTSVGVQFACDERCGWARIEVDGSVRWVGNSYKLTDYVEIFPLSDWKHSVTVTALGYEGGEGSTGEVRILAIGQGELHQIYLPFISR